MGVVDYNGVTGPDGVVTPGSVGSAGIVHSTPAPLGTLIPANWWGLHLAAPQHEPWPTLSFKTLRLWDIWPGVSWGDINTADGVYDWTQLDAHLAVINGQDPNLDIIYCFGYVPTWVNGSQTAAPTDAAWTNFVTAIVDRYKTSIQYWELWNEPNEAIFWTGTDAQMVHLAELAAPIIRAAGCTVLSPAPQGSNAYNWFSGFFAAGGAPYCDIIAFHSYTYEAPETLIEDKSNLDTVLATYSQQSKELWDTEGSWGDNTWPFGTSDDLKQAYVARLKLLSFSLDIDRSCWYAYDNDVWGTLEDKVTDTLTQGGIAYQTLYGWIAGKRLGEYVVNGTQYHIDVYDTDYHARIVWDTSGTVSYTVPEGATRYVDLNGNVTVTNPGASISIGIKPILLDVLED